MVKRVNQKEELIINLAKEAEQIDPSTPEYPQVDHVVAQLNVLKTEFKNTKAIYVNFFERDLKPFFDIMNGLRREKTKPYFGDRVKNSANQQKPTKFTSSSQFSSIRPNICKPK